MANIVLKTSADDLYELVRLKKKISVEDAAKILKMSNNIVQALVDFFVEEKIFGIEYKFTTPYVYISHEEGEKADIQNNLARKLMTKEEFFKKAGKWNVSDEKINMLWKKYVQENLNSIKKEFYTKANARNITKEKVDVLWKKYQAYLN